MEEACRKLSPFRALWLGSEWRGGAREMGQLRLFRLCRVKGGSHHPFSKCFISDQHLTDKG